MGEKISKPPPWPFGAEFKRDAVGPFYPNDIAAFLEEYGYTANPAGLVPKYHGDFTFEGHSLAWLDIHAIAVRKGDQVPDRPVRITLQRQFDGVFSRWKLLSVKELAAGVPSNALDRNPDFPKSSPWPKNGIE